MNWEHLRTFLWLRWRLRSNRMRRAGTASIVIEKVLSFLAAFAAAAALMMGFAVGLWVLPRASALVVMFVWDGVVAAYLFVWMTELMIELQRSELLSFDKFLHLPVSLSGVFLINYVASLFSLSMTLFLPVMIGLSAGLAVSRGAIMLSLFPVVAAFFLMVTALTHQFRGWLASLMENKRRRRTVITVATIVFMLLTQLPNLLNFSGALRSRRNREAVKESVRGIQLEEVDRIGTLANMIIPPGWVAYGARTAFEGAVLPSLLATLGLSLIGVASLKRSYRTTMRLYTGQFTSQRPRSAAAGISQSNSAVRMPDAAGARTSAALLEKRLPWISEHASAIALAGFRSLLRAPESKMMLLTPVIMIMVFGATFLRANSNPSEFQRPLMAAGTMGMVLIGLIQLAGNQFGLDRSGFRVFVLAPASRKDVLLGKNLALLPLALGLGTIATVAVQFAYPMRIDHFLAAWLQILCMYLVFCIIANFLSMLAPTAIASGSLKPARPKGTAILIHLVFFFFLLPAGLVPTLIPLAIEFLLNRSSLLPYLPVYLLLALAEFALAVYLYTRILAFQGRMLHAREQKILEVVTAHPE